MPGDDLAHHFGTLAARVLDRLRLVENQQMIAVPSQLRGIAPEQRVGGQHHVVPRDFGKTALALGAVQRQDRQTRCKTRRLVLPVENQRSRQDDQRRMIEPSGFLFEQQVRQGLGRLAETHVVGEDSREILFAQELQPGQTFGLVVTQFQPQSGRRIDVADSLCGRQLLGERQHITLSLELPTTAVVEFRQARRVEARQTQAVASGKVVEEIDQRRCQRLQTPGRRTHAQAARRHQFDHLLVGDLRQQTGVEPACVTPEQGGEQRCQRQTFAFDDDAHVEVEPAALRFDEIRVPGLDIEQTMAKILGELDLPAGCAQTRQFIAHEERPHTLLSEAIGIFRRPSKGVQHVARDFLEAGVGQLVHPLLFESSPTLDLDRFPAGQHREIARVIGDYLDIGIAKNRQGDIEKPSPVVRRVFTPAAVAMRLQGLQTQHRQRLGNDAAHADAGLFGVARQLQRRFGERFANQCHRRRRQRRQREQARDDRRIATHLQRAELVLFEIDVPRSLQGNDQAGCGFGHQHRQLAPIAARSPANRSRTRRRQQQGRKVILAAQPTGLCHQLQRLAAVPGRQAEGPQTGVEGTIGPQQAENRTIVVTDETRWLAECAIDAPQFVRTLGIAALAYGDPEAARIRRPVQNVEDLLATAGGIAILLADRHGHPTQLFGPREHAGISLVRGIRVVDRLIQHARPAGSQCYCGATSGGEANWSNMFSRSVAKIAVLDRKIADRLGDHGDAGLQLITLGAADTHCVALDRGLHLDSGILDQLDDLFRQFRLDADPDLQFLLDLVAGDALHRLIFEALGTFLLLLLHRRKEQVLDLAELEIGIAVEGDEPVFLVQLHLGTGPLEVVTIVDRPLGHVYRIVQCSHVGF
ncbi:MAG: hypothetical protein AW09_002842 [Candidatus Accumulibacter phosphatis]|uniref:Uncharacterized protein n=1 Tax=Candidatus Accumulibacter phosphatis TaxID=327160 RepID=A0A080LU12_9PROT|nr:MAG: hypothetical protein AW09_002842 [Candidatus Accumulibacter phosphatis]